MIDGQLTVIALQRNARVAIIPQPTQLNDRARGMISREHGQDFGIIFGVRAISAIALGEQTTGMLARQIHPSNGDTVAIISIIAHKVSVADAGGRTGRGLATTIPVWLIRCSDRNSTATVKNSTLTMNFRRVVYRRQLCGNNPC